MTPSSPTLHHRDHAVATAYDLVERLAFPAAVLDEHGIIRVVNRAWKAFAAIHGGIPERTGIGVDYLAVCDHAASDLDPEGARFGEQLRRVLLGQCTHFELESRGPHPARSRAVRLDRLPQPLVVVTHEPRN